MKEDMKRLLLSLAFIICHLTLSLAYNQVRLVINSGIDKPMLKQRMERAVSVVMTEVNRSHEANLRKLELSEGYITREAKQDLNRLWENEHFRCVEEEVVERCLTTRNGYQVRGIPLIVNSATGTKEELGYQEAVVNFDENGTITSIYYTINPELYSNLRKQWMQEKHHEVTDLKDRMMILEYVEHFRTAYNQKDIKFLRQVFSTDALIITGKFIKVGKSEMSPNGGRQIVYRTQSKKEYLENLEKAFRSNSYIKVRFEDVVIVPHPTIKGIFGVTVRQKWNTPRYSDEGYVFMVWDFRNPDTPQIHVRTWQPEYVDKEKGQRLNPNDVFTLGDFDL